MSELLKIILKNYVIETDKILAPTRTTDRGYYNWSHLNWIGAAPTQGELLLEQ